jgi:hypothetical protein
MRPFLLRQKIKEKNNDVRLLDWTTKELKIKKDQQFKSQYIHPKFPYLRSKNKPDEIGSWWSSYSSRRYSLAPFDELAIRTISRII